MVTKCLTKSIANAKGHICQQFKKYRSTSKIKSNSTKVDNKHTNGDLQVLKTQTNVFFATLTDFQEYVLTRKISTDQTGRLPILSNRGNQYIMVMYDYTSNAILVELMKTKYTTKIIAKYTLLHDRLCCAGIKPLYQKVDNEAPEP